MKVNSCKELPEDCWELILSRLVPDHDYGNLKSLLLVCKQFLSITDRLRKKLVAKGEVFYDNRCKVLCGALERFPNLKRLELYDKYGDINCLFPQIASSTLDVQSLTLYLGQKLLTKESFRILGSTLNNLKVLICRFSIPPPGDGELIAIADAFPQLEELDIRGTVYGYSAVVYGHAAKVSNPIVADAGIEILSRKLKRLRKIDISGNLSCSDWSLIALSSNCEFLNEIRCRKCCVTEAGILFVLRHSPNLTVLQAGYISSPDSSLAFDNSKIYARTLRVLELCAYGNQDRLFFSVAKAGMPLLERFRLFKDYGLNFHGLSTFLLACPSLKHLELAHINFLDDQSMEGLCRYLPNVVSVKLFLSTNLTVATFFILAKECPRLSEVTLKTDREVQDDFVLDLTVNDQITYLDFSRNSWLNDELLQKIGMVCPNLHTLDVRGCESLTEEGICGVLKCCTQIKHLALGSKRRQTKDIFLKEFKTRHIEIEYG